MTYLIVFHSDTGGKWLPTIKTIIVVFAIVLLSAVALASAVPVDPVLYKFDPDLRYQYVPGPNGVPHLVDLWFKASDAAETARYQPDSQNEYHLFTRANPSVSQPLVFGQSGILGASNYDAGKRTVFLVHGWLDSVTSDFNAVLVPAFLAAEDVNVVVVDWSAGGGTINYVAAVANTVTSGESVARFINWLNSASGSTLGRYHIVGFSLGAHQAGIIGRNVAGNVAYITGLDPAFPGWITNDNKFRENDGTYTEIIHTNAGLLGYLSTLGHVDFYPNGGINMPGCSSQDCDHARCFHYLAESLTRGGFTGRRCVSYITAMTGNCLLPGSLNMGGLTPKTGSSGIFYLETNAASPFSRG